MVRERRSLRQPPSARRLLVHFLVFAAACALVVMLVVGAILAVVRSQAERDVDGLLLASVRTQLAQSTAQQSDIFEQELATVQRSAEFLAGEAAAVFERPTSAPPEELARFTMTPEGTYVTKDADPGKASMFYSGAVPIGPEQRAKAEHAVALDPALQLVKDTNALVAQAYLNTWDSLNRIYPGFDVRTQYEPKMDIPSFNFYYLADATHDPDRKPAWTTAYVDPAGQGWMTSAIAPVYIGDTLEGVVGIDITLAALVGELLSKPQAFGAFSILVDESGTIVAMPPAGERLFGLTELTDFDYSKALTEDIVKPAAFNIDARNDTQELSLAMASSASGTGQMTINGTSVLASWTELEQPGPTSWHVISIVPEAAVAALHAPGERMKRAATATLWVVAAALALLVLAMTWLARRHSLAFTRPLEAIDDATARIAEGDFHPTLPPAPVAEIERTGAQLLAMGASLEHAQRQIVGDSEALREKEQRYRAIFDNVADPVLTLDRVGTVIDANDAANTLFGFTLPGHSVTEGLRDEAWRTPGRRTGEIVLPDGVRRTCDIAITVTGEGADQIYTVTLHDMTAEAEARQLTQAARITAERTARVKDEFLASMSHEIRTPLNGVIGVLSLLAERDLPEDARRELAVARRSADDLLVLVNDVLDFAKIEANQVSLVLTDVRLADVLEGVRQLYAPLAAEQHTTLSVEVQPGVPDWVRLDQTRVRQVLVNLVSNALKFTEQGSVRVVARLEQPSAADAVGGVPAGGEFQLRIEVIDTGVGVAPEVQSRLFTRFSQGDPLATRKFPGTGLGLAIVKRLSELMGGQVGMVSTLGQGSTFWFTVRSGTGRPDADVVSPPSGADRTPAGSLRVLVAEDNEVNRYLIVAILQRLGHDVLAAVNGREAVEAAQQRQFDVVLMDVQMPVANGIDATRAIRALPGPISRVPILAVTANVLPEQQALYRSEGFTGLVAKPLTLDSVAAALATVTPQPATAAQTVVMTDVPPRDRFDAALIEQYRSAIGPAGSTEMVELFVRTLAERRAELGAAIAAGDLAEAQRLGHALKGMAAAVGAARLSAAGAALQHAMGADALDGLLAAFDAESVGTLAGVHAAWGIDPA
ncbi:MAG: ATP-binding protein [Ilumatobacteraceae bacterium]